MKETLRTIAIASGLALAGVGAVGIATAEAYGGEPSLVQVDSNETDADAAPAVASLQDTDGELGTTDAASDSGRGCNGKLAAAAEAIGIEVDALRAELDAGQSISDVATANGVNPDAVVDAMVDATEDRLDDKVAEGRLTQDEADTKLAEKTDRIVDKVFGDDDEVDGPTAS